jgi:hypothetical protein
MSKPCFPSRQRSSLGWPWNLVVLVIAVVAAVLAGCGQEERATVPDLVGMQEAEARDAVSNAGLVLGEIEYVHVDAASVEAGSAAAQAPSAGSQVTAGSEVALVVAGDGEKARQGGDAPGNTSSTGHAPATKPAPVPTAAKKTDSDPEPLPGGEIPADIWSELLPPNLEMGTAVAAVAPLAPGAWDDKTWWSEMGSQSGRGNHQSSPFIVGPTRIGLVVQVSSASGGAFAFGLASRADQTTPWQSRLLLSLDEGTTTGYTRHHTWAVPMAVSEVSGVASCVVIVLAPHDGDWTYQVWQNAK